MSDPFNKNSGISIEICNWIEFDKKEFNLSFKIKYFINFQHPDSIVRFSTFPSSPITSSSLF